ncbi:MAG: hypothetical protein GY847_22140 [Proteobacteria bacterium]|nr:hypothetical protein [Pseudomonadota bacterium]
MNLRPLIMILIMIVLLLAPFWISHLIWRLSPNRELSMLVFDYTVPTLRYSHHQGLFWLLNHIGIRAPGDVEHWRVENDYLGYKPGIISGNQRIHETVLDDYNWVYVADTYGVYDTDLSPEQDDVPISLKPPKLIFGALSEDDAYALKDYVTNRRNIILEFNTFGDPTKPSARAIAESLVGVHWTGWAGRFFDDLSDESSVPTWLPKLHEAQYPGRPLPSGPGILLVHKSSRIVILDGEVFEKSVPVLRVTNTGRRRFPDIRGTPPYFGWFAIVSPKMGVEVLAEVFLPTPLDWKKRCRNADIPIVFPLLTELSIFGSTRLYISANLANLDEAPGLYQLAGLPLLQAAIHRRRDTASEKPAYWQFYVPVMGKILKSASQETN